MTNAQGAAGRCAYCTIKEALEVLTLLQVLETYEKEGIAMIQRACNDRSYLEALTGLDKLHSEGDAALESVDWDEEED